MFSNVLTNLNHFAIESLYEFEKNLLSEGKYESRTLEKEGLTTDNQVVKYINNEVYYTYSKPIHNNYANRLTAIPVDVIGITLHCLQPLCLVVESAVFIALNLLGSLYYLLTLRGGESAKYLRASYINFNNVLTTMLLAPIQIAEAIAFAPAKFFLTLVSPVDSVPMQTALHGKFNFPANRHENPTQSPPTDTIQTIQDRLYEKKISTDKKTKEASLSLSQGVIAPVIDISLEIVKQYTLLISSIGNTLRAAALLTKKVATLPLAIIAQIAVSLWDRKNAKSIYQQQDDIVGDVTYSISLIRDNVPSLGATHMALYRQEIDPRTSNDRRPSYIFTKVGENKNNPAKEVELT